LSYIYLGSPYTGADAETMRHRYEATCLFTAVHMRNGTLLFSPIVHCHELAVGYSLPRDWGFWRRWCIGMLAPASHLWILRLEGWQESRGVREEIDFWKNQLHRDPIFYDPV
jgi:hypothetical protein